MCYIENNKYKTELDIYNWRSEKKFLGQELIYDLFGKKFFYYVPSTFNS